MPAQRKAPVVWPEDGNPKAWREALGDGSFGGLYQRSSEDESRLWEAAVQAIRTRLDGWAIGDAATPLRRQSHAIDPGG